jgi:D-alanyl-D-alanine carboxypeptidase
MNKMSAKLKLNDTTFVNPHGLSNKANKSTAYDVAQIAYNVCIEPYLQ